jgi:hypothetical protein
MDGVYKKVDDDRGFGSLGEWPAPGEHDCIVNQMTVRDSEFRQGDGQTFPGVEIQFHYELVDDPDHDTPLQFRGAPFRLPVNASDITAENTVKRIEIETARLKGHFKTILGRDNSTIPADLEAVDNRINEDTLLVCRVRCQERQVGTRTYRTEFLQETIDA